MINRRAVYVYKKTGEKDYIGMAMNVHLHNGRIRFVDTDRGHEIQGRVTQEDENTFTFLSEGHAPGEWHFKILTLQDFKRKYSKRVCSGDAIAAAVRTTEDLHEWYRKEFV